MFGGWTEFEMGLGRVVRVYSPEETKIELCQYLLNRAVEKAYGDKETSEGVASGEVVKIGNLGEGRELVVGVFSHERRSMFSERLLTGQLTKQPVVALVEGRGRRVVIPLAYGEDVLRLGGGLSAKVIDSLGITKI